MLVNEGLDSRRQVRQAGLTKSSSARPVGDSIVSHETKDVERNVLGQLSLYDISAWLSAMSHIPLIRTCTYAWLNSQKPFIVSETLLFSKRGRVPSLHLADVGDGLESWGVVVNLDIRKDALLGEFSPSRDVPVLLGNDLKDTSGICGVRGFLLEVLGEIFDTEEDPVMQVAVVELVLELFDAGKRSVDVVVLNQGHQGCLNRTISGQSQDRVIREKGRAKESSDACPPKSKGTAPCHDQRQKGVLGWS